MALLDHCLQCAGHSDAVAAHDAGVARPVFIEHRRPECLAVFGAKFENVTNLDRPADIQRIAGLVAQFAGLYFSKITPLLHLDVALDVHVSQVLAVIICAGDHAGTASQHFVRQDWDIRNPNCSKTARVRAEGINNFPVSRSPEERSAKRPTQLGLLELIITTKQDDHRFVVGNVDKSLDLLRGGNVESLGQVLDGFDSGRFKFLHLTAFIRGSGCRRPLAGGFFNVSRIVATLAVHHIVFAGLGRHHEFVGM